MIYSNDQCLNQKYFYFFKNILFCLWLWLFKIGFHVWQQISLTQKKLSWLKKVILERVFLVFKWTLFTFKHYSFNLSWKFFMAHKFFPIKILIKLIYEHWYSWIILVAIFLFVHRNSKPSFSTPKFWFKSILLFFFFIFNSFIIWK